MSAVNFLVETVASDGDMYGIIYENVTSYRPLKITNCILGCIHCCICYVTSIRNDILLFIYF
jgi:hypothetical protein